MVYTFRFQVVENVSGAAASISTSFGAAGRAALAFSRDVDSVGRSTERARDEMGRFVSTKNRAFSIVPGAFGAQLGSINAFVGAIKGGLAAWGLGSVLREASGFSDRMYSANAIIQAIVRNQDQVNEAQRVATTLSNQTGTSYLHNLEGLSKMLTVTRGNVAEAGNLTRIGAALAALNPAEGFEGALFALKEIEGGDTMSLRERFNIRIPTASEAQKIAERDGRTVQQVMFDSLQQYLDNTYGSGAQGAGVEFLLNIRANTIQGQLGRIGAMFTNIVTPIVLPFLQRLTAALSRLGDWVQGNQAGFQRIFDGMVSGVGNVVGAIGPLVSELQSMFAALWPSVQQLIGGVVRLVQAVLPVIVRWASALLSIVRPALVLVVRALGSVFESVAGFFERNQKTLLSIVDAVAFVTRAILGAVVLVYNAYSWVFQQIRSVVEWLGEAAAWAAENNPFSWMIDLVNRVIPGFKAALGGLWGWVKGLFSDLTLYIWETFIKPVFGWLGNLWSSLGLAGDAPNAEAPSVASAIGLPGAQVAAAAPLATFKPAASGDFGVNKALGDSIAVQGERTGIRNITINIGKQIEQLTFNTVSDLGQMSDVVRREIERALADAVNQSNYAL